MSYDVIVIGAGPGGASAAYNCAKRGLNTCLIDSKPKEKIGIKICGNGLIEYHLKAVNELKLPSEIPYRKVNGIELWSPNRKKSLLLGGKGYTIDRCLFGNWLIELAEDAGAEFRLETKVRGIDGKKVILNDGELEGDNLIVATGYSGFIKKLGINFEHQELAYARREIRVVPEGVNLENLIINFDQNLTPGGYGWIFPEAETNEGLVVNVGIGVVSSKGKIYNLKDLLGNFISSWPILKDSYLIEKKEGGQLPSGGGVIPITTPKILDCIEKNVLLVGDAGATDNSLHGGGIGPAMEAGLAAADAIKEAIEEGGDVLEYYFRNYIKRYGNKQIAQYPLSRALQGASNREMNIAFRYLITQEDIQQIALDGELNLSKSQKILRGLKGLACPTAMYKLAKVVNFMKEAKQNKFFVEKPDALKIWKEDVDETLKLLN